jgi:hypothetical protein
MASDPSAVTGLFEQIPLEAMQQVSDSYMSWYVDRVTRHLDETMANLRTELRDNDAKEASYRPSAKELDAIERLQRSGVTGTDLLDRMVEQGEDWLMLTMRRLDHFERTGLAPKDYSTWCEHALSGAYDWIDHERLSSSGASATSPASGAPSAPRPAAPPPAGGVPEWMGRGAPQRGEESPTAPVPGVTMYRPDSNYYSQGQDSPSQPGPDSRDGDGRNKKSIFSRWGD